MGGSDSDATEGPGAGAWIGGRAADPGAMLAMRLDADENTRVLAKANPGEVGGHCQHWYCDGGPALVSNLMANALITQRLAMLHVS